MVFIVYMKTQFLTFINPKSYTNATNNASKVSNALDITWRMPKGTKPEPICPPCPPIHIDNTLKLTANDIKYKIELIKGIWNKFRFSVTLKDLESIVGPDELKSLLKKFKPSDYELGKITPNSEVSPAMFDNVKAGTYRVNLHAHTNYSDGYMSINDYLKQSVKYADKVAKLHPDDGLPPYTSAITDHNNFDGVIEIIKKIAQNPKKYKNFKFVPGCEFMFYDKKGILKYPQFEAVVLGFNPFDNALSYRQCSFLDRVSSIPKMKEFGAVLSYAHPMRHCQQNPFSEKLLDYLRSIGVNGMESNYQYLNFVHTKELGSQIENVKRATKNLGWFETGGTDTHATNIFHAKAGQILNELF